MGMQRECKTEEASCQYLHEWRAQHTPSALCYLSRASGESAEFPTEVKEVVTLLGKSKTPGKAALHPTFRGHRDRGRASGDTCFHGVRDWLPRVNQQSRSGPCLVADASWAVVVSECRRPWLRAWDRGGWRGTRAVTRPAPCHPGGIDPVRAGLDPPLSASPADTGPRSAIGGDSARSRQRVGCAASRWCRTCFSTSAVYGHQGQALTGGV